MRPSGGFIPGQQKSLLQNLLISLGCMSGALIFCSLLHPISKGSEIPVPMIFMLAVFLVSLFTDGYLWGIVCSILAVYAINYVFTYPYFQLDFTRMDYPVAFFSIFTVSFLTSTVTSRVKEQEQVRFETERERMRANLLRAISHDLRTPLTSISGAVSAILENRDALTMEERTGLLRDVQEEADWLIRMVENLLSVTRMDGEAKVRKEPEAAEEIIGAAVYKFSKLNPSLDVSVSIPDKPLFVPMDGMLIEQVLNNLLINAVVHGQYTSAIRITLSIRNHYAVFAVEDNGAGIPESDLPNILEGYFTKLTDHAQDARDDRGHGLGIGLSVCLSIVQAHGGTMTVKNQLPHGCRVEFSLPLGEDFEYGNSE